jgi:tight adherence protein C
MPIVFYVVLAFIVFGVVALMLMPNFFRPSVEAQRVFDVVKSDRPDIRIPGGKEQFQDKLLHLASNLRMRAGVSENPRLKVRLAQAGIRSKAGLDSYFAAQYLVPLAAAAAGTLFGSNVVLCVLAFGVAGYLAPDMWLNWMMGRRRKRIRRSIPDALDLMVICVEAGLGIDQALLRIGQELEVSHADIHDELIQVNREQRAGRPRLEAWQNLAERTEIEEFRSFVNMLTQTDKFGTPIAKALTRFSEEIRTKRKQAAEEAAAKTKIKIIFPLVLCIFPCIFIVLLAPAVLNIMSGLKGMSQ